MANEIPLLPEQEALLIRMVEAARRLPPEEKRKFILAQTFDGDDLVHPGLLEGETAAPAEDLDTLSGAGLLAAGGSTASPNYYVTPRGYAYYEQIKTREADPVEQVEREVRALIESADFGDRYPVAHAKWLAAAKILWHADSEADATTIGHHCREAVQAFATHLVEQFAPEDVDANPAHDVARIKAVLAKVRPGLGESEAALLDALLGYWGAVTDLTQRQEHGSAREGTPLEWEDSRRLVFQIAVLFYEFDRSLRRLNH
jgi:hypothetical protein